MPGGVQDLAWQAALFFGGTTLSGIALIRKVYPLVRRVTDFLDDWQGRPARLGHPAQPGVMERLETLEETQARRAEVQEQQAAIQHEHAGLLASLGATVDQIRAWMESQGKPPMPPQQRSA